MIYIFKNNLFLSVFIFLIILFVFFNLPRTFYQQDEWQTLGHNLAQGLGIFKHVNPFLLLFGELRPLSGLMYLFFLGFVKFTVVPAAIFAIIFHAINSGLVFYLVNKISKKKIIAIIASIFFVTNSISHQAITWVSAVGTLPAATFILFAIIAYLRYIETSNKKYILVSFIFTIVSLYFKGVGIFLFMLLPLMCFIYKNKSINIKNIKSTLVINLPFFILGLVILLVRVIEVFLHSEKVAGFAVGAGNSNFIETIIIHVVLYPLTSLLQIFVPPLDLYAITQAIAKIQYKFLIGSPLVDLVVQSIVADMLAILGSLAILLFLGFIANRYKDKVVNKNMLFAVLFFFLSFLPYIALDRDSSYLSSRYFYLGAIGAGILFGYIIYFLSNLSKYAKWIVFPLVFLYLFHHVSIIRGDINHQVKLGNERKAVLNGIKSHYPKLDKNSIFYVTSDKQYYGDITNPFQNGLGYVLEVWYYDSGNIPKEFLSENYLWDLGAEGYRKRGNKGFGYFQDMDKMVLAMEKNKLSKNIVHAFFFNSKTSKIENITDQTRARLATISGILK